MNYLYIQTPYDRPSVYLGTADNYSDAEQKARQYRYLDNFWLSIFPIKVVEIPHDLGFPAIELVYEGRVGPSDRVNHYLNCAGSELDQLPREQQAAALQGAIDWLTRRMRSTLTNVEQTGQTTGS